MILHEDNILNKFRIWKERHIRMRKLYQLSGWTKNSSYHSTSAAVQIHYLPHSIASTWPLSHGGGNWGGHAPYLGTPLVGQCHSPLATRRLSTRRPHRAWCYSRVARPASLSGHTVWPPRRTAHAGSARQARTSDYTVTHSTHPITL